MATTVNNIATDSPKKAHAPTDAKSKARLEKAVKDFEAMLVGYMLKSMRSSIPKDDMMGDGFGEDMMESMFDGELSKQVSKQSNLGLAEMLYRGVTGEQMHPATPGKVSSPPHPVPAAKLPAEPGPGPGAVSAPVPRRRAVSQPVPHHVGHVSAAPNGSTVEQRVNAFAPMIQDSARKHGVDANLLKAVMASESGGDSTARSPKDAKGLMQLIDSTASAMGVRNVWDPKENIDGGAKYLQQMLERFDGNVEHAVASYNAGPGAVEKHGGIPPIKETRDYVSRVMSFFKRFAQQEGGDNDEN